jgi:hypothetical protein
MSFLSWIKGIFSNPYVKILIDAALSALKKTLTNVSQNELTMIKNKIIMVSKLDISNQEKFQKVAEETYALLPNVGKSYLNLLIETIIRDLKDSKAI